MAWKTKSSLAVNICGKVVCNINVVLSSNVYVVTNFIHTYFSVYERFAIKVQIITAKGVKPT